MADVIYNFAEFRLDCGRFELVRGGRSVKLERKPMDLLILLAGSHGRLVSREEIAERLWGREVFVDTEHGINTAIRKIRLVLRDDSDQPRFVQTVAGKGYRFISSVSAGEVEPAGAEWPREPREPRDVGGATLPEMVPETAGGGLVKGGVPVRRTWRRSVMVAAVLAMCVAGAVLWRVIAMRERVAGQVRSLAVLPLDNLSSGPGEGYLAEGMTDELTTMLAKSSTLQIVSRTSVMQYKGAHRPLREIARELGVDGVLEGSISRTGDKVHMTVQLIRAADDRHLWAESYDRRSDDLVQLPREAAMAIATRLGSAVATKAERYVRPEAHDAYLRGRYLWSTDHTEAAAPFFKKAIELQPEYAPGWMGLSIFYSAGAIRGLLSPEESLAQAEAAAQRAVALDDGLAEAHEALGAAVFVKEWDWTRTQAEVGRAILLDPKLSDPYHFQAKVLAALNRHDEAIASQRRATELEPFSRPWATVLALLEARRYDAALAEGGQILEADPQDAHLLGILKEAARSKGMGREAADFLARQRLAEGDVAGAAEVRKAFSQGGYRQVVELQLTKLEERGRSRYVSPVTLASLHAQNGERDKALDLLEDGLRHHAPGLLWMQCDAAFDGLHADPRYRAVVQAVGLPATY